MSRITMMKVKTYILTIKIKTDERSRVYGEDKPIRLFKGYDLMRGESLVVTATGENQGIISAEVIDFLEKTVAQAD